MPNQRDIRLLCKPIVERRSDLIHVKRYLLFVPLRSIFAGICFEQSSDRDDLQPRPIVRALCRMKPEFPYAGENAFRRAGYRTWREVFGESRLVEPEKLNQIMPEPWLMSDPDYPDAIRNAIEADMLPKVAEFVSWERALEYETRDNTYGQKSDPQILLPYFIALGEFDRAGQCLRTEHHLRIAHQAFSGYSAGLGDRLAEQGDKLSMEDKRKLVSILHEREAAAIHAMKLEKHWEPTPFPVEEEGLV